MSAPVRTCVGCRDRAAAVGLVRIAWDETSSLLVVDGRRRHGGRGAWLHPDPVCLSLALRRRAFGRALRRTVTPEQTEGLSARIDALAATRLPVGSTDATSPRLA